MEKISIAEATRRVVWTRPSMLDALRQNVINYKALAEAIHGEVQTILERERKDQGDSLSVSVDSIQAALLRYAEGLKKDHEMLERRIGEVIKNTVLELKNDLVVFTVTDEALLKAREAVFEIIKGTRLFHLIQGNNTFTIIADQALEKEMLRIFTPGAVVQSILNQSGIILISPKEIVEIPGVVSYLHGLLANKNINVTQSISCYRDTILIINRAEALEAYAVIEEQILRFRTILG